MEETQISFENLSSDTGDTNQEKPFSEIDNHKKALLHWKKNFTDNNFGFACNICDRLWYEKDLKKLCGQYTDILQSSIEVCGGK